LIRQMPQWNQCNKLVSHVPKITLGTQILK